MSKNPESSGNEGGLTRHRDKRFFGTAHLEKGLNKRSVRGGAVTMGSQALKFVLQMGSTAVLARLLSPDDFGLIAMVGVFVGFAGMFKDLGLSMATVQRSEIDHEQVSTMFWINVGLSTVLALITAALAPLVAWFYGKPELLWITMAVGSKFIFSGLSAQHTALLRRQMRFPVLALVEIVSLAVGIATAIFFAWQGWGYWALVLMGISEAIATAVMSFCFSGWLPGRPRNTSEIREMVRFGGNLTGFSVLNYLTRNFDNLLIGRFVGAGALGFYSKAYAILLLPIKQINNPMGAVAIPALSRLQSDPERFREYYLRVTQALAYATMPLVVLLGILSDEVVLLLLGEKWSETARIFRVFTIFAFFQSVIHTTGWVQIALGRTRRLFKWGVLQSGVTLIAFPLGLPWGAYGVAMAATIQALIMMIPTMLYTYHQSPVRLADVARALLRPLGFSVVLLAVTFTVRQWTLEMDPMIRIALVLGAALVLLIGAFTLYRPCRNDFQSVLRNFRR